MKSEIITQYLSASQLVRLQRKADTFGTTVEECISSFLAGKVGTTRSIDNTQQTAYQPKMGRNNPQTKGN